MSWINLAVGLMGVKKLLFYSHHEFHCFYFVPSFFNSLRKIFPLILVFGSSSNTSISRGAVWAANLFFTNHWISANNDSDSLMPVDRKSTRLNSSHVAISYAVFCLK